MQCLKRGILHLHYHYFTGSPLHYLGDSTLYHYRSSNSSPFPSVNHCMYHDLPSPPCDVAMPCSFPCPPPFQSFILLCMTNWPMFLFGMSKPVELSSSYNHRYVRSNTNTVFERPEVSKVPPSLHTKYPTQSYNSKPTILYTIFQALDKVFSLSLLKQATWLLINCPHPTQGHSGDSSRLSGVTMLSCQGDQRARTTMFLCPALCHPLTPEVMTADPMGVTTWLWSWCV